MLFTTQRNELLEAVQNLSRIVTKTSLPVLEGILISAEQGKITLVSYNLEMSMKKVIYANCEQEGDIVISAKLLTEILRRSDGIQVTIEADERLMCHIRSGNAVFDIMGMSALDFPETPSVPETEKITLPAGLLRDMVKGTLFAVAALKRGRRLQAQKQLLQIFLCLIARHCAAFNILFFLEAGLAKMDVHINQAGEYV